jgi:thioredoxin 1
MKNILIGVGVVAVIGIIGYVMSASNNSSDAMMKKEMAEKEAMMMKDKIMMDETIKKDEMMQGDSMQKDAMMDDKMMMDKKDTTGKPTDAMVKTDSAVMIQKDTMAKDETAMMQKGSYVAYSEAAAAQAVTTGKTILFFHASWCPTCRAADADIIKNAANIPSGTTILKVDYDTSSAMKTKYGVTTQHTFVQVDSTMNAVATWRGGNTLASIIASSK